MTKFVQGTKFRYMGISFEVAVVENDKVKFVEIADVYNVYEMNEKYLQEKLANGKVEWLI